MLIARDGSSKQRGHGEPPAKFAADSDTLFPSGSAALYRRKMLDEIGLFDERFFLYCEDTDLGLRARWAGWECVYVAGAVVEHRVFAIGRPRVGAEGVLCGAQPAVHGDQEFSVFDAGAGAVFRRRALLLALLFMMTKDAARRRNFARQVIRRGCCRSLVLRAHASALVRLPYLVGREARIFKPRRLSSKEFRALLAAHSISVRKVAEL